MFYLHNETIRIVSNDDVLCPLKNVDIVINELVDIKNSVNNKKNSFNVTFNPVIIDDEDENEEDSVEDKFTAEGINRCFQANPNFVPSEQYWQEDSIKNWKGLSGPELFSRYEKHAEIYCQGCRESGREPTYEGFREWLIGLKSWSEE